MNNKSSKCTKSRKKHPKKLKNIMKQHKMSATEKSNMQQPSSCLLQAVQLFSMKSTQTLVRFPNSHIKLDGDPV